LGSIHSLPCFSNRPATLSESHALYGMDPLQIAERGLADVEKAALKMDVSNNAGFHFCKGRALELAESFGASRGSYLKALSLDPSDKRIKERLERLDKEMGTKAGRPEAHLAADDFECSLCFKLFYEPVTTCCGHTFCRSCLLRSQDYGNRCPACRTVLFIVTTKLAVNVTLKNIIEKNFKAEYERRGEEEKEKKADEAGKVMIPLFVMDVVLPHQRMALNIFEPRYRLLIRRAMGSSQTFGMIGLHRGSNLLSIGCEVEIVQCDCLPDGRFHIEVAGTRRFKVSKCEEQDGYRLATSEYLTDKEESDVNEVFELAREVGKKADDLLDSMRQRAGGQMSAVLHALLRSTSNKPDIGPCKPEEVDPQPLVRSARAKYAEDLSFWVGSILSTIQQVDTAKIIEMTSTRERLEVLANARIFG